MKWLKRILYLTIFFVLLLVVIYFVTSALQETRSLNEETRLSAPGKFIRLTDGVTHYLSLGSENDTPLLFIHGGGITGMEVWSSNANFFVQQGYRVVLYDLYGRGYSDRIDGEYNPDLLLRQLEELTAALNLRDSLTVISMSLGSMVALDFATKHPEKVEKIVMIDPAITGDYRANKLLQIPGVSDFLMTLYWYPRAVENQRKEFIDQAIFEAYAKRLEYFMEFEGYKHTNYSTWMHTLNQNKLPLLAQLPATKVMLIYGNRDPYFPMANVDLFLKTYPALQIREIYDAGHMPHLERSGEVNQIMLDFLY